MEKASISDLLLVSREIGTVTSTVHVCPLDPEVSSHGSNQRAADAARFSFVLAEIARFDSKFTTQQFGAKDSVQHQ